MGYTAKERALALQTYRTTRDGYGSRAECCAAIAKALGAHENTVVRWVNAAFGRPRLLSVEELPAHVRALEAEVERLRAAALDRPCVPQ